MMAAFSTVRRVLGIGVLLLMAVVASLATVELGWVVVRDMISPPIFFVELGELFEMLGVFLLVLITLELYDSVYKTLAHQEVDHAEVTLRVAIIAVARKVILLDAEAIPGIKILALAGLILALVGGTYILVRLRTNSSS